MIRWIVGTSLRLRFLVVVGAAMLIFYGATQVRNMPVDVYPEFAPPRVEVLGWVTYNGVRPHFDPPFEARVIHPEPPATFKLNGKDFDVLGARRPPEMEVNEENLAAGRRLYYRNCMYCHGDYLDGKGHFADALNPLPANFRDQGTISQLEEGYLYWRIATGGPGLPDGATPWNSAMPVWQDFMSEEEIWQVIAYIYAASGSTPRTWDH